nr:short chain dehydrogenase andi [Quercus suber]
MQGDENPSWTAHRVLQFLADDNSVPSVDLSILESIITMFGNDGIELESSKKTIAPMVFEKLFRLVTSYGKNAVYISTQIIDNGKTMRNKTRDGQAIGVRREHFHDAKSQRLPDPVCRTYRRYRLCPKQHAGSDEYIKLSTQHTVSRLSSSISRYSSISIPVHSSLSHPILKITRVMASKDLLLQLPAWAGSTFVSKLNHAVPPSLNPTQQTLPYPFVAVITGASRSIGKDTAKAFAQAGATGLILTARTVEALQEAKDACEAAAKHSDIKVTAMAADSGAEISAIAVAEMIKKEHGGHLNLLVNNAVEIPTQVNYLGRFYMTKHLLPLVLANGTDTTKAIVNISSIGGHVSGPLGFSISALATNRLSQRVAEAYADQGVFSAAVHPGAVWPEQPPEGIPAHMRDFSNDEVGLCGSFLVWLVKEHREWLNGRYVDATWDVEELEKKRQEIVDGDKLKMRLVV